MEDERIRNADRMKSILFGLHQLKDDANAHIDGLIEASTCMQIMSLIIGADESYRVGKGMGSHDIFDMPHNNLMGEEHQVFLDAITLYYATQRFIRELKGTIFENKVPEHLKVDSSIEARWETIDAFAKEWKEGDE